MSWVKLSSIMISVHLQNADLTLDFETPHQSSSKLSKKSIWLARNMTRILYFLRIAMLDFCIWNRIELSDMPSMIEHDIWSLEIVLDVKCVGMICIFRGQLTKLRSWKYVLE